MAQFESDWSSLVSQNTREDDYVNATAWCKRFKKRWAEFQRLPESEKFIKTLAKINGAEIPPLIQIEGKGRGSRTWVHPLVAIKLSEWLSTEFDIYVKQIFKRYLEGDLTLAEEIIERSPSTNPDDYKRIEQRARAKQTNKTLNHTIQEHGGNCFAAVANINNKAASGMSAKQIKAIRQVKNTRDGMSTLELNLVSLAENLESAGIKQQNAQGNGEIIGIAKDVAHDIASLRRKYTGEKE